MSNDLDNFILYDSETQYYKNHGYDKHYLFEIYGKTSSGILFERDLVNQNQILLHVGDGLKKTQNYIDKDSSFFRKNQKGSSFFSSYKDYKDFVFNKKELISKKYILDVVKRYIYLESPQVWASTLMGGGGKGVLKNPNWMYGTFLFEDNNEYTIIKKYDTVKIFKGKENMYAFSEKEEYCSFILDEELYKKALKLNKLKRYIALNIFGCLDIDILDEYSNIYKDLDVATKFSMQDC